MIALQRCPSSVVYRRDDGLGWHQGQFHGTNADQICGASSPLVYAGRGAVDILCAADIGSSVNGRVYGTSRPASSYPADGHFRSLVCRQYRNGHWVFEEPDVVAYPDGIGFHKEHAMHNKLAWRYVLLFCMLTYALSWGWWLLSLYAHRGT
ncbi:MAG: hypothetical protein ABIV47_13555 [Roseiflexaceae bacterium]